MPKISLVVMNIPKFLYEFSRSNYYCTWQSTCISTCVYNTKQIRTFFANATARSLDSIDEITKQQTILRSRIIIIIPLSSIQVRGLGRKQINILLLTLPHLLLYTCKAILQSEYTFAITKIAHLSFA